jgi:hypothetical protein
MKEYGTAVARILSKYSLDVVLFVCDPYTGLPGKSSFMPSIAEIRAACEARASYLAKIDRLKSRARSLEPTNDQLLKELEKPRPTMDELHAKYGGPTWGIDQDVRKSTRGSNGMTLEQVLEHYKTHHLNPAQQPPAKSKSKRDRGKRAKRQG